MAKFENFYETVDEAVMRLQHTLVLYDGHPYYILAVTNHKKDGIFRVYLDDVLNEDGPAHARVHVPFEYPDDGASSVGDGLDKWLDANPDVGVIRKMANSPKFDKFRPFPLGMVNKGDDVYYVRRTPVRPNTQQGLTQAMMVVKKVSLLGSNSPLSSYASNPVRVSDYALAECITNQYPDIGTVISSLNDKTVTNTGAAFHREFAIVRGPLRTLYLAYRDDIIGILPDNNTSELILGADYKHCREVVENLSVFYNIKQQK